MTTLRVLYLRTTQSTTKTEQQLQTQRRTLRLRQLQTEHVKTALGVCPVHKTAWKAVPAGVSKRTGKEYSAFYSCPDRECKNKPVKAWTDTHPIAA